MNGSCNFVLHPSKWQGDITRVEDPQPCPYPRFGNSQYCAFHSPSLVLVAARNEAELHAIYKRTIQSIGTIKLLGCTVWYIDFQDLIPILDLDEQINIGYSTFTCEIDFSQKTIDAQMFIVGCNIHSLQLRQCIFSDHSNILDNNIWNLDFRKAEFRGEARLDNNIFGKALFDGARFMRTASFCEPEPEDASIEEADMHAGQHASEFIELASFVGTEFHHPAHFSGVKFQTAAIFFQTLFGHAANFKRTTTTVGMHFGSARFEGIAGFSEASLGYAAFVSTHFNDIVVFEDTDFGGPFPPYLTEQIGNHIAAEGLSSIQPYHNAAERATSNAYFAYIAQELLDLAVSFQGARPDDYFYFEKVTATSPIDLRHLSFDYLVLEGELPRIRRDAIALEGSTINRGEITISEGDHTIYQLTRATIGAVDIYSKSDQNIFEKVFIADTKFDGFDFSNYRDSLIESNWNIDNLALKSEVPEPLKRETTYSKAKAGAGKQGDTYAESKFFIKERRFRRKRYISEFKAADSLATKAKLGLNIVTNALYDFTCEFGENPRRVMGLSIGSIFLFAISYWFMDRVLYGPGLNTLQFDPQVAMNYLNFSLQAFTSFFIPGTLSPDEPLIHFLSSIQSFLGAFAIALIVATVVRTVKR